MKPTTLQAIYSVSMQFDVEEVEELLNIKWEDVKEWYVKYGNLKLRMNDGTSLELDGPDMNVYTDWKHPEEELELDEEGFPID